MKKLLLVSLFFLTGFMACKKEDFIDDFISIEQDVAEVTFETPHKLSDWLNEALGREEFRPDMFQELFNRRITPLCYNYADLMSFLAQFGSSVPDIIPTIPNDFFQDANCTVARWTAMVFERDAIDYTANSSSIVPTEVLWKIDSDPAINTGSELELKFYTYTPDSLGNSVINEDCPGFFQPSCNGYHNITITMTFANGSIYQRSGTGKAHVNYVPEEYPDCDLSYADYEASDLTMFDFDCYCLLTFEAQEFLLESGLEWDLNTDGYVSINDLFVLLSQYGC
jgi:hypothetical protein